MSSPLVASLLQLLQNSPQAAMTKAAPTNQPSAAGAVGGVGSLGKAAPAGKSMVAMIPALMAALGANRRRTAQSPKTNRAPIVNPSVLTPTWNGSPVPIANKASAPASTPVQVKVPVGTDARTPPFVAENQGATPQQSSRPQVQGGDVAKKLNVFQKAWQWSRSPEGREALMASSAQLLQPTGQSDVQKITSAVLAGKQRSRNYKLEQEQRQLAMQEYQRKAGLEEREQTRKEADTASQAEERRGMVGTREEANKIDWARLGTDKEYKTKTLAVAEKQADAQMLLYQKELEVLKQSKEKAQQTHEDEVQQRKLSNQIAARQAGAAEAQARAALVRANASAQGDEAELRLYKILLPAEAEHLKTYANTQLMQGQVPTAAVMDKERQRYHEQLLADIEKAKKPVAGAVGSGTATATPSSSKEVRTTLSEADAVRLKKEGYDVKAGDVFKKTDAGWQKVE